MTTPGLICVGGSSGSIPVLQEMLLRLPRAMASPIVIVLHRHVTSQDTLKRLLGAPDMPAIVEPYDKEAISGGAIYLAPPNYHLMVDEAGFCLSTDPPVNHARPSIDILFGSVARYFGARAVAVVLSGANADGAAGCAQIAGQGGRVLVQDPKMAHAPQMPQAALDAVEAAGILAPADIVAAICSPGGSDDR